MAARGGGLLNILDNPEFVENLEVYYLIISVFGIILLSNTIYEFFVMPNLEMRKRREIKEEEVFSLPYPYDQDKLQLIIGLKHKWNNLELVETPEWVIVPERAFSRLHDHRRKGYGKRQLWYPFTMQMMYYKAYDPNEKQACSY